MTSCFMSARALRNVLGATMFALTFAVTPPPASAQEQGPEASAPHIGPFVVRPAINWQTEYNDNVFRTSRPVADVVSTIGGSADVRGQMRRVALTAAGSADWVHYSKYASERGANISTSLRMDVNSNHFVPYVSTSYGNTRSRINLEIDTRPRVEQLEAGVGGILRFGAKTSLDFSARRTRVAYDHRYSTEDGPIYQALNRSTDHFSVSLLQQVTPLTRLVFTGETDRADFNSSTSSFRNSEDSRVTAGFESDGRIKGRAMAGLRFLKFRESSPGRSRGVFIGVGTNITVVDRLQVAIDATRDVEPSYRSGVAYYEAYGYGTSITYAIRRAVKFSGSVSRRFSDYRDPDLTGLQALARAGTDIEMRYGPGVGFRIGDRMGIDFTGLYVERRSFLEARRFEGWSFTAGVKHAF